MFRRKPKSRLEQAREELERIGEEIQQQASVASEEIAERLKNTAEALREELDHLEDEAREQGKSILDSLEELVSNFREAVPKPEAEKRGIPWGLVLVAFGIGLVIGIILNNRD